jgi:hypothetical protein
MHTARLCEPYLIGEHHLIEIVGTLIDNAYEACTEEKNQVLIEIDSQNDKLIFTIKNQVENIGLGEISHFFEKGFSTKEDGKKHGLGLYNACEPLPRRNYGGNGGNRRKEIHQFCGGYLGRSEYGTVCFFCRLWSDADRKQIEQIPLC